MPREHLRPLTALIACGIAVGSFFVLYPIAGSHILGADESVYATEARSWIEGTPADQFEIYRPVAMPAFGWIALQFSDAEKSFRIFGVIWGALTPAVIFVLFWRIAGWIPALLIALATASSPLFLRQAPLYLNDIPSAMLLCAVLLLIYIHYETGGRSRSIYLAAPLAALAFYMRYAAATPLFVIALVSYTLLIPRFVRFPHADLSRLLKTGILAGVLLVPHVLLSLIETHEALGVLRLAGEAAHRVYVGEGLVQYMSWIPGRLGGVVLEALAIMGAVTSVILLSVSRLRQQYVGITWVGCIGALVFILTGLLTHAEPRYVFFPLILLAGTGIAGLYHAIRMHAPLLAYGAAILAAVLMVLIGATEYEKQYAFYRNEEVASHNVAYMEALAAVRADGGGECAIWTQMNRPRASWYTRCHLFRVIDRETFRSDAAQHHSARTYSIVGTRIPDEQITPENASRYGVELTEIFRREDLPVGELVVYRLTKKQ